MYLLIAILMPPGQTYVETFRAKTLGELAEDLKRAYPHVRVETLSKLLAWSHRAQPGNIFELPEAYIIVCGDESLDTKLETI